MTNQPTYSLWLLPTDPEQRQAYDTAIKTLAETYHAPAFIPHITIWPDATQSLAEIIELVTPAVSGISPVVLQALGLGQGETYSQCVYQVFDRTPEMITVRDAVIKALNLSASAANWLVHLSLLYGDFPIEQKIQAREHLETLSLPTKWMANELIVILSDPDPLKWKQVATIPFLGKG